MKTLIIVSSLIRMVPDVPAPMLVTHIIPAGTTVKSKLVATVNAELRGTNRDSIGLVLSRRLWLRYLVLCKLHRVRNSWLFTGR